MWDWSLEPTASLYYTQNALEPLHAQFDYLKNTVSVYNDYFRSFKNYKLTAEIYDLNSKKISSQSKILNSIGEDSVLNNVLTLNFPKNITPVHFIKLLLFDEKGNEVANSFYWRSINKYEGSKTMTGPATAGFEPLEKMKATSLNTRYAVEKKDKTYSIDATIKNPTKRIAFFIQLQLLDKDGKPVRPSLYTDNFFSLLPGEGKHIIIETSQGSVPSSTLVVKGWNIEPQKYLFNNIEN